MARAFLIGILVAAIVCAGSAPASEDATPGAVAGIGGGGPVSLQSGSAPIVAAV